jgi:hypothetical protein
MRLFIPHEDPVFKLYIPSHQSQYYSYIFIGTIILTSFSILSINSLPLYFFFSSHYFLLFYYLIQPIVSKAYQS